MKQVFGIFSVITLAVLGAAAVLAGTAVAHPPLALLNSDAAAFIGLAGLLVNKEAIDSLFTGLKTIFHNALTAVKGTWQETAMEVQSTGAGEDYAWLTRFPKMRKWIGEKYVKALEAGKYYKANEDWETTIEVDRNDIRDDRLGIYNRQSQMAGESAGELYDIISDDLKNNAFTATGIDGQYFYDTDHPVGKTSVSNKLTVALSAASVAAADASIGEAIKMIMSFKDEEGMPLRLVPDTLEVGPALLSTANLLATAEKLADGAENPYRNMFRVLVNPAITSTTQWMLHVTKKQSVKPFIVQVREAPNFVSQTSMENDGVFMNRMFKFGAEARATGLYGFWQLSVGSTGAG